MKVRHANSKGGGGKLLESITQVADSISNAPIYIWDGASEQQLIWLIDLRFVDFLGRCNNEDILKI
jgi:hypothetical protein